MRRALLICVLFASALLMCPSGAFAGVLNWDSQREYCGSAAGSPEERDSGQSDADGRFYLVCSEMENGALAYHVRIAGPDGTIQRMVPLTVKAGVVAQYGGAPALAKISDVAPSPHGDYLYTINYDARTAFRFDRQPNGSYALDPTWALADFPADGSAVPKFKALGMFLATDANGDIYMSMGLWSPTDAAIVKYHADGSYVTRFGRQVGGSWALGDASGSFAGVTVTASGSRVFVADENNSRVQRFDRQANGTYVATRAMGNTAASDPGRAGECGVDGKLAAPYDVALTPRGAVAVVNTTCYYDDAYHAAHPEVPVGTVEIGLFTQDGAPLGMVRTISKKFARVHGIAIDARGGIHLAQGGVVTCPQGGWSDVGADNGGGGPMGIVAPANGTCGMKLPAGDVPGAPDTAAPVISVATGPTRTTNRTVTLTVKATDLSGITQVRVNDAGTQFAWHAWSESFSHTLSDKLGDHLLLVQVMDGAGNVSAASTIHVWLDGPSSAPSNADKDRPTISTVALGPQSTTRRITIGVRAADNRGVTRVRFATETGVWGAWRPVSASYTALLTKGAGWKGMFVQVSDAAGNRSRPYFQSVLMAPLRTSWLRGTAAADSLKGTARSENIDLSRYDGRVDHVRCGAGYDTVLLQPGDVAARDCEHVVRIVTPTW